MTPEEEELLAHNDDNNEQLPTYEQSNVENQGLEGYRGAELRISEAESHSQAAPPIYASNDPLHATDFPIATQVVHDADAGPTLFQRNQIARNEFFLFCTLVFLIYLCFNISIGIVFWLIIIAIYRYSFTVYENRHRSHSTFDSRELLQSIIIRY